MYRELRKPHEDRPYCILDPSTQLPIGGYYVMAQDRHEGAYKLHNLYCDDIGFQCLVDSVYEELGDWDRIHVHVGRILNYVTDIVNVSRETLKEN